MNTLILDQPGTLSFVSTGMPPSPGPGEVQVRVHRVGVCGTDIHAFHGRQPFFSYPRVIGHELGVEVVRLGPNVQGFSLGDKCAVEPYLHCGQCVACRRGKRNCCTALKVLGVHADGGGREYMNLPAAKLHPSDRLSYDQLALVETLAIGAHAVARARLEKDEAVLVVGAGPIGLSVIQFVVAAGIQPLVLDVNEDRLRFCRESLGLVTLHGAEANLSERIRDLAGGEMPTAVFDATGNAGSMAGAFNYPANGGRLVFVGLFRGDLTFNDPDFHRRELDVLASRNALPEDFCRVIAAIEHGEVDTRPWITHRASARDVPGVFPGWTRPETGVLKAMIDFDAKV